MDMHAIKEEANALGQALAPSQMPPVITLAEVRVFEVSRLNAELETSLGNDIVVERELD